MKIELTNLTKKFEDDRIILDNINFNEELNTLALIGPSGGGKSTLLRIIGGLIKPTSGVVSINGVDISYNEKDLQTHRKDIGFVFQQGGLFRHMTALDNICTPLINVHKVEKNQAIERSMELLARFGLEKEANKKPFALSGGQQQRIAIARAVASKPKFLILDEPTSALDPEFTTEVLNIVNELRQEGMKFLIVTHEMGFARHACEKAVFLHSGKLIEFGESSELFNNPQTEELKNFFGKVLEWQG